MPRKNSRVKTTRSNTFRENHIPPIQALLEGLRSAPQERCHPSYQSVMAVTSRVLSFSVYITLTCCPAFKNGKPSLADMPAM